MSAKGIANNTVVIQIVLLLSLGWGLFVLIFPRKVQDLNVRLLEFLTPWNPSLDRIKEPVYATRLRLLAVVIVAVVLFAEFAFWRFPVARN